MIKCKSAVLILFCFLYFINCATMSENSERKFSFEDSPIKEDLIGKSLGMPLFPVYFSAVNQDSLFKSRKFKDLNSNDFELLLPEVSYSFGVKSETIQNSINFQLKGIFKKKILYTYKTDKKLISNDYAVINSKQEIGLDYLKETVAINRVLDPLSLSRGFLWSVGDQHQVDLLLLGSVSIESAVFKLIKNNSYFLYIKIEPLLNICIPHSGEYVLSKDDIRNAEDHLMLFMELENIDSDEKLVTYFKNESQFRKLLMDSVADAFMPYYPFLSSHFIKVLK